MAEKANELRRKVIKYINVHRGIAWSNQVGHFKVGGRYIRQGIAGLPDVIALLPNGETIYIEIKIGKDKLSNSQEHFKKYCDSIGAKYYIVKTTEDIETIRMPL